MFLLTSVVHEYYRVEGAVVSRHIALAELANGYLMERAILPNRLNTGNTDSMLSSEFLKLGSASHRAIGVENLTKNSGWRKSR
jgi:hypothetical protein